MVNETLPKLVKLFYKFDFLNFTAMYQQSLPMEFPTKLRLSIHFLETQLYKHPERDITEHIITNIIKNGRYMISKTHLKIKYDDIVLILDINLTKVITAYPETGIREHDYKLKQIKWKNDNNISYWQVPY